VPRDVEPLGPHGDGSLKSVSLRPPRPIIPPGSNLESCLAAQESQWIFRPSGRESLPPGYRRVEVVPKAD